jgi:hypothetical protein
MIPLSPYGPLSGDERLSGFTMRPLVGVVRMGIQMQKLSMAFALLLVLPALAAAGEIYGKITAGGTAVGEGTEVSARCGAKSYPAAKTDKTGSFHLVVAETGKCTLTVAHKGLSATVDVVSYDEGAQADIVLDIKDGQLSARRR